ncbi:MAG: glycosyltransferase, partial [Bacteroidales bacterium]
MIIDFLQSLQWEKIPMHEYILLGVFSLSALIQLAYYCFSFRRVANIKTTSQREEVEPVSLVIRAKNELHNLEKNLPLFLAQNHPKFEVIVVNDASSDKTDELLYTLKPKYPNLVVTTIEQDAKFLHDKKLAITIGVKAAQYDCIIFTEPDCIPTSNHWLLAMQQAMGKGEIVLGYCRKIKSKGFANLIMRCDDIMSSMYWIYAAICGKPYRGTIKNMGFRQRLFLGKKGFAHYNSFPCSEETVFLCRNGNKNTRIALEKDAILTSSDHLRFSQWMRQKSIYASLLSMGGRGIARMRLELISRSLFYLSLGALLVVSELSQALLLVLVPLIFFRMIFVMYVHYKLLKTLQEKGLFFAMLFYDILAP